MDDWPAAALVLDSHGRVSTANRQAAELFGRDRERLVGVSGAKLLGVDGMWGTAASRAREFDVSVARAGHGDVAVVASAATSLGPDGDRFTVVTFSPGRLSRRACDTVAPSIVAWTDVAAEFPTLETDVVCVVVGVVGLRAINDGFSRSTGDLVLTEVARRLSTFAASSTRPMRTGGSRFVLLMSPGDDAAQRLSALVTETGRRIMTPLGEAAVACAVGAVHGSTRSPLVLIGRADRALDAALLQGAGTTVWDGDHTRMGRLTSARLAVPLLAGLTDGSISAEFVPVVDSSTGTVQEFRAHACWSDDSGRRREEREFMDFAELLGIRAEISWMLVQSAIELSSMSNSTTPALISVSVRARDLCRGDAPDRIRQLDCASAMNAGLIRIDLEGGVAPTHVERLHEAVAVLRQVGFNVAQQPTHRHGLWEERCEGRPSGRRSLVLPRRRPTGIVASTRHGSPSRVRG